MSPDARSSPLEDSAGKVDGREEVSPGRRAAHPLGPLVLWSPLERPVVGRLYAAGIAAAAVALLVVAGRLTPDVHGVGTHRQLGLPACGFMIMSGLPCPTCGMTTAFSLAVRGRILSAMQAQAAGLLMALATFATAGLAVFALASGRKLTLNWYRISPTKAIWLATLAFLLAWGAKLASGLANR